MPPTSKNCDATCINPANTQHFLCNADLETTLLTATANEATTDYDLPFVVAGAITWVNIMYDPNIYTSNPTPSECGATDDDTTPDDDSTLPDDDTSPPVDDDTAPPGPRCAESRRPAPADS